MGVIMKYGNYSVFYSDQIMKTLKLQHKKKKSKLINDFGVN